MGKGLGIAGLVVTIIGALMPVIGLFVCWAGLILATFAALGGSKALAVASSAIAAVAFVFLTPSLWIEAAAVSVDAMGVAPPPLTRIVSICLVISPFAAMLLAKQQTDNA